MSKKKQRIYSAEFKAQIALEAIREEKTVSRISSEHEMPVNNVINWKREVIEHLPLVFNRNAKENSYQSELRKKEEEMEDLYKEIGQLTTKLNWLKKNVDKLDFQMKKSLVDTKDRTLSLKDQCEILNLNRSSYYYKNKEKASEDPELITELTKIYEETPFYGYRRSIDELKEKGFDCSQRKVLRLKSELGLKTLYPKRKTTISNKEHKKYPYLLKKVEINKSNKVWATDITYLSVGRSVAYLVAVIDWSSRKILSYRISNTMERSFCIEALQEAFNKYGKPKYFNSDQGSQFTSDDFIKVLKDKKVKISMDGKGRWADNIIIERFFRSLKYEEVYLKSYESLKEAKVEIGKYINFYNSKRKHSSLGKKTPDQFYLDKLPKKDISRINEIINFERSVRNFDSLQGVA
jgi:putative transposase